MKQSRKIRKRPDPVARQARAVGVPEQQIRNGGLQLCDVVDFSAADTRKTVRSGERQTVRRQPKLHELYVRGVINIPELLACRWYQAQYEAQYETRVKIADWQATAGTSDKAFGHWPATDTLGPGANMWQLARQSINPAFLPLFERVVLHGRPLGKLAISFRSCARRVLETIEGQVEL